MKELGISLRDSPQPPYDTNALTVGMLMSALRRQALPLVVCTLVGLLLGAVHYLTSPPQYFALSKVLVDDRMSELAEEISANVPFVRNDTSLLNEMQVLKSLHLAVEVTTRLELQDNPAFVSPPSSLARGIISSLTGVLGSGGTPAPDTRTAVQDGAADSLATRRIQRVAARLQNQIRVQRAGRSFSIDISFLGFDPQLTADIVNTYAEAYLDDHLNASLAASERSRAWMVSRLRQLQQTRSDLAAEIEALRSSGDRADTVRIAELAQRRETVNTLYASIVERYEQIAVQGSVPVTGGRILTAAIVPRDKAAPKAWEKLALGGLIGLIIGLAVAVTRESRERFFRTGEDVLNHTQQAFLGYFPKLSGPVPSADEGFVRGFEKPQSHSGFVSVRRPPAPDTGRPEPLHLEAPRGPSQAPARLFASANDPLSAMGESLRNVHITFGMHSSGGPGRILAVTSMLPGEGKTTVSANYANLVASFGERTLLVDGDLRNAGLSRGLQEVEGPGVIDVLRGTCGVDSAIRRHPDTGLSFLPCGRTGPQSSPTDVFDHQGLAVLLSELRSDYDEIVVDLPALAPAVDAKAMLPRIDRLVLVVEWGKTPRSLVKQYLTREPDVEKKVLGLLLNKVDVARLRRYAIEGGSETYLRAQEPRFTRA